jgi:hypothetical protein
MRNPYGVYTDLKGLKETTLLNKTKCCFTEDFIRQRNAWHAFLSHGLVSLKMISLFIP